MRLHSLAIIVALCLFGCDRAQQLTFEQSQQVEAARRATVATSERLLGRTLTDSEKACIHVDYQDGKIVGAVAAPLSDSLKQRQADLMKQSQPPT